MKLALLIIFFSLNFSFSQSIETELLLKINALRKTMGGINAGLSPFVRNTALDSAALYHAKWVVVSGIGSHVETNTVAGIKALTEPWDRAAKYGVTAYAENLIQYNFYHKDGNTIDEKATATGVFECWKKSKGHYENMVFKMTKIVEPRIGIALVNYNNDEFCIVMLIGANVDSNGQLTK